MRLTEVLVCVVLLMISAGVAGGALIAGQKGSLRLEGNTRVLMSVLDADLFLRNEASLIDVPYFESLEGKKKDIEELFKVIELLKNQQPLPPEKRDHALTGDYSGYRECHVHPDFLLVYKVVDSQLQLYLYRTGTHSDLFG